MYLPITIPPFPRLCSDFTDNVIPTTTVSFNGSIQASYWADTSPADGLLDSSSLLWFRPLRRDGGIARVDNGGALITLNDAQISASFVGGPATAPSNGLLRGFLRESDTDQIIIAHVVLPGGSVILSSLLAGATGACSSRNDKDLHDGDSGWWFYFNFVAEPVTYLDP